MNQQTGPFDERELLDHIAQRVGTPFYVYDGDALESRLEQFREHVISPGVQPRYAMKACSAWKVLEKVREAGVWIDAVSGNEILRARKAGFPGGWDTPAIVLTADVFRDNALDVLLAESILPTIGTPQMVDELAAAGFQGPVGIRLNPGFGHGHVKQCDTGGPASKHGIWHEDEAEVVARIRDHGFRITLLHAHIGTGPDIAEFRTNITRLADFFAKRVADYPDLEAVDFGGGVPHPYRPGAPEFDIAECGRTLRAAQKSLGERAGRELRVEIEPGRAYIASAAALVTRVRGRKRTLENEKGPGHDFALVDAGFCDLVRPAMYGSHHEITVPGKTGRPGPISPQVLAGPLCESGDVFTRDSEELLDPRELPALEVGDLVVLRDAGAYGAAMSSNYNSIGRVPQVWVQGGEVTLISRRETFEDVTRAECNETL